MAWYNFWKSKKAVQEVEQSTEAAKPTLSALDFPKSKYTVYWETFLHQTDPAFWVGEVRFIGYNGTDHRSIHSVTAPTKEQAQELAHKLIVEKMNDYKR